MLLMGVEGESEIERLWQRVEAWSRVHAPMMVEALRGPVNGRDVAELEATTELVVPADLRESLAVHDGEGDSVLVGAWCSGGRLLSAESMLDCWGRMLSFAEEPDPDEAAEALEAGVYDAINGPVHAIHFSPRWLPFMELRGGRSWYLDFDPAPGGKPGQVIEVDPERMSWAVVAQSFSEFFAHYVGALENAEFDARDANGIPIRSAELEGRELLAGGGTGLAARPDINQALARATHKEALEAMRSGTRTRVAGLYLGVERERHILSIHGGKIWLQGDLPGHDVDREDLWLTIDVEVDRKRWLGRRAHRILSWKRLD